VSRTRLDDELVRRGLYQTRSRARDAINRGTVLVDGMVAAKPAQNVSMQSTIEAHDPAQNYVSRAALKLEGGIKLFDIDVKSLNCLDIGASTGGFTEVLLRHGASHVTAIDVGHGQLDPRISSDPRVTSIEGLNARDLASVHLAHAIDLIACDVSFISLKLALPSALALAQPGAKLVALIKPQFEVGRGGDVTDPAQRGAVCEDIARFLESSGWSILGLAPSPIQGGDGNEEFLIGAEKKA
jgi:23S rRNA (cytidine1920-2'-O)/16S rRNA (cytidine1409-2'-O)-methyltransferase